MDSASWNWLLTIVSAVASVGGFIFSWMAWIQALKARDAARDAVIAVRTRNLAHNVSAWAGEAKQLLGAVRELKLEEARRIATELLGVMSRSKGWQTGLQQDAADVAEMVRLLDFVNNYLSDEAVFTDMREKLMQDCQMIFRKLHEMAGNIDAQVEAL